MHIKRKIIRSLKEISYNTELVVYLLFKNLNIKGPLQKKKKKKKQG